MCSTQHLGWPTIGPNSLLMGPFVLCGCYDPHGNPKRPLSILFWPLSWADSAIKWSLLPKSEGQTAPQITSVLYSPKRPHSGGRNGSFHFTVCISPVTIAGTCTPLHLGYKSSKKGATSHDCDARV